jgi:hypothetical protein
VDIETALGKVIHALGQQALRNVVLLKYLQMYPQQAVGYGISHGDKRGFIIILDARASAYDRDMYPEAKHVVLISSDGADLTERLLDFVPPDPDIVFKFASNGDRDVVAARYALRRTAVFYSYTGSSLFERDPEVVIDNLPPRVSFELLMPF